MFVEKLVFRSFGKIENFTKWVSSKEPRSTKFLKDLTKLDEKVRKLLKFLNSRSFFLNSSFQTCMTDMENKNLIGNYSPATLSNSFDLNCKFRGFDINVTSEHMDLIYPSAIYRFKLGYDVQGKFLHFNFNYLYILGKNEYFKTVGSDNQVLNDMNFNAFLGLLNYISSLPINVMDKSGKLEIHKVQFVRETFIVYLKKANIYLSERETAADYLHRQQDLPVLQARQNPRISKEEQIEIERRKNQDLEKQLEAAQRKSEKLEDQLRAYLGDVDVSLEERSLGDSQPLFLPEPDLSEESDKVDLQKDTRRERKSARSPRRRGKGLRSSRKLKSY